MVDVKALYSPKYFVWKLWGIIRPFALLTAGSVLLTGPGIYL